MGTRTLTAVNDANDANDGSYSEGAPTTKKKRKKMGGKRSTKRNKTCRLNNTTINPGDPRGGYGCASENEGQGWEAGEA